MWSRRPDRAVRQHAAEGIFKIVDWLDANDAPQRLSMAKAALVMVATDLLRFTGPARPADTTEGRTHVYRVRPSTMS